MGEDLRRHTALQSPPHRFDGLVSGQKTRGGYDKQRNKKHHGHDTTAVVILVVHEATPRETISSDRRKRNFPGWSLSTSVGLSA